MTLLLISYLLISLVVGNLIMRRHYRKLQNGGLSSFMNDPYVGNKRELVAVILLSPLWLPFYLLYKLFTYGL